MEKKFPEELINSIVESCSKVSKSLTPEEVADQDTHSLIVGVRVMKMLPEHLRKMVLEDTDVFISKQLETAIMRSRKH